MPVFVDRKEVALALPQPLEPDQEQHDAAEAMVWAVDKALFSDPGAGKTLTALQAVKLVMQKDSDNIKTLVLCPTVATREWAARSVAHLQSVKPDYLVQIVTGNAVQIIPDADMVIVTYGTISRKGAKVVQRILEWAPTIAVYDESHNLNNGDSTRTQVAYGPLAPVAFGATYCFPMTGTPITRYQDGLWPMLSSLFQYKLKLHDVETKEKFLQKFCVRRKVKYGNMRVPVVQVTGNRNLGEMKELLYGGMSPVAIRNKLKIRSVPLFSDRTLTIKPSKELLELQKKVLQKSDVTVMVDDFGNPVTEVNPEMAKALHMYGCELAPAVAAGVRDLLLEYNSPVFVLFWHRDVGKIIQSVLINHFGVHAGRIAGSISAKSRQDQIDQFNNKGMQVLLGQIAAMGVAINLQKRCNVVAFAEDTYSDAMNLQAYQRVWRRGQEKDVHIVKFKTLMPLADLRPNVATRKGNEARKVLD